MRGETRVDKWQTRLVWVTLVAIFVMTARIGVGIASQPNKIVGIDVFGRQSRGHDDSLRLTTGRVPPVGGIHHNEPQECGIYLTPVKPERAIHSLEHGAVWITYQPALPEADIVYLQDKVRDEEYLLLSPFPGQRSPVVLTAWGVQLEALSVHDARIEQFVARYLLGPMTPERGAPCAGTRVVHEQ